LGEGADLAYTDRDPAVRVTTSTGAGGTTPSAEQEPAQLPPFVFIVDEFVDLLEASPGDRELQSLIARFSQPFRFIGGSVIAATQCLG
jgi:DNA segregation ATPase FtsK/SpoIIIE-like protein